MTCAHNVEQCLKLSLELPSKQQLDLREVDVNIQNDQTSQDWKPEIKGVHGYYTDADGIKWWVDSALIPYEHSSGPQDIAEQSGSNFCQYLHLPHCEYLSIPSQDKKSNDKIDVYTVSVDPEEKDKSRLGTWDRKIGFLQQLEDDVINAHCYLIDSKDWFLSEGDCGSIATTSESLVEGHDDASNHLLGILFADEEFDSEDDEGLSSPFVSYCTPIHVCIKAFEERCGIRDLEICNSHGVLSFCPKPS